MSVSAITLANDYKKLLALVEQSEEMTLEMIADTAEGIEGSLGDKLDAIASIWRDEEGAASVLKAEEERLAMHRNQHLNKVKSLKSYALSCLLTAEMNSLKTTKNTFTARKGTLSVVIDNADLLPDNLVDVVTTVAPDKKKIKEAIEAAEKAAIEAGRPIPDNPIPGAHLETGSRSLQVR